MEPIRILIADDEQSARDLLVFYLQQSLHSCTILQAADGRTALELLSSEQPDLLFLDIKMPELNGIEVLQGKETGPLPAIIFTTAFDEYALPAFDHEAVDYLLKPFTKERFDKAMDKTIKYIQFTKSSNQKTFIEHISTRKGNKTQLIPVSEIQYLHAEGAYVEVIGSGGTALVSKPLYELEAELDPLRFVRVHRSLVIAVEHIKEIISLPNGDFTVCLKNGKELRGSRTYKNRLKRVFAF